MSHSLQHKDVPPPHAESDERWYAVYTQPHKEQQAARHLRNQEFEVFLPLLTKTVRHARQFRVVKRALFPQYLFVQFNPGVDTWRSVNGTFGAVGLVMSGNAPCALPEGLVESVIDMTDDDGQFSFNRHLKAGDKVRVESGPFANFIGQLEQLDPSGRALLLLDMMGREVRVWSNAQSISLSG